MKSAILQFWTNSQFANLAVPVVPGRVRFSIPGASLKMFLMSLFAACTTVAVAETCPPLTDGIAPRTVEELWAGIDPRAEPIEVEVLKEWEQDGIVLKVLRYRIGMFNGERAMMAAVYGYPKGGTNLPGLVHIHGGGQPARHTAVLEAAKQGYATISIAWAGKIYAPGYMVGVDGVKLYWEGNTNDPNYKVTTDWGGVDGYHAPCRYKQNGFAMNPPSEHSVDPVPSARNSGWFLVTIGARRALTFLERQPEVDADRLGVFGFSMGGKLSVMVAGTDDRVKAAAPSAGGISDRYKDGEHYKGFISDDVYLERIHCPIAFLVPSNDFHARINNMPASIEALQTDEWRVTHGPHLNHNTPPPHAVVALLWFDQHLKGSSVMPATPKTDLQLKTPNGVPTLAITADPSKPIKEVDVYYTQQGKVGKHLSSIQHAIARFWNHAPATGQGAAWSADLPILNPEQPLWVFVNVTYPLETSSYGAGDYVVSSLVHLVSADELSAAGVKPALESSRVIETFEDGWEKEWFMLNHIGLASTHKVYGDQYKAPAGASLAFGVRSAEPNTLVLRLDDGIAEVELIGGPQWQEVLLLPSDFKNSDGKARSDWKEIRELKLSDMDHHRVKGSKTLMMFGKKWSGESPVLRSLRWVVEAPHASAAVAPGYRNVALNAKATTNSEYPHPSDCFAAKHVVDGKTENKGHGPSVPSWGPQKLDDLWLNIEFEKEAEVDKAVIYVRADFKPYQKTDHDSWWKSGVLEFSDGSKVPFELKKTADPQVIRFPKRKVSSVKFTKLVPAGEEWRGFCEVEFWGNP